MVKFISKILLLILMIGFVNIAYAVTIDQVDITGNKRIPLDRVSHLLVKAGDEFDIAIINQTVKNLYQTGYFSEIKVDASVDNTKFVITYIFRERPLVADVVFEGNEEYKRDTLIDKLPKMIGETYDIAKIGNSLRSLLDYYEGEQRYGTTISHRIEYRNETSVNVVFIIDEAVKSRIYNIWFYGNENLTPTELRKNMITREKDFWSVMNNSGTFVTSNMEIDREILQSVYFDNGYANVEVGEPEVIPQEREGRLNYIFQVEEGPQYSVDSVSFSGNSLFDNETLYTMISLKAGDIFNASKLRADMSRLALAHSELGYARVNVSPEVMPISSDRISIVYRIDEGGIYYINRVNITGNSQSFDNVIRRQLDLHEREMYNAKLINEVRLNLMQLGYYSDVRVPEKMAGGEFIDLNLNVTEQKLGSLTLAVTYSTTDQFGAKLEYGQRNVLGRGVDLNATIDASTGDNKQRNYVLRFTNPWVFDRPISVGFDLQSRRVDYLNNYSRDSRSISVFAGHQPIKRKLFLNYRLTHEELEIFNIHDNATNIIKAQEGLLVTNHFTPSVTWSVLNNNVDPTDGYKLSTFLKMAGGPLGGEAHYFKSVSEATYYKPLSNKFTGSFHGEMGFLSPMKGEIPVDERFYLGGMSSVRGFGFREISPRDADGEPYGGVRYYQFNAEFWRPIVEENISIRAVVFFDMGQVFTEGEAMFSTPPRKTAGFGIRFFTPMGLLRLEYGYKLDKKPGEDAYRWDFSIGSVF